MNKETILKVLNEFAKRPVLSNIKSISESDFPAIAERLSQDWVKVEMSEKDFETIIKPLWLVDNKAHRDFLIESLKNNFLKWKNQTELPQNPEK